MATRLATPGVYIVEKNAFPSSVAAVPTAVPAFVGYTQITSKEGRSLINRPVRISSLGEFIETFGIGFDTTFHLEDAKAGEPSDFIVQKKPYKVVPDQSARFILFEAVRLFYNNGGGTCHIVSVGPYYNVEEVSSPTPFNLSPPAGGSSTSGAKEEKRTVNQISKKALEGGLQALIAEDEPTMVVIPEAVMLEKADCFALQQAMLMHCGYKMKDRIAIFDIFDGHKARTYDDRDVITQFREGIGSKFLDFGAAYYPWVLTSIVQNEDVSYANLSDLNQLANVLNLEAEEKSSDNKKRLQEVKTEIAKLKDPESNVTSLNQTLKVVCPSFKIILDRIRTHLNILPPSAGMAGIITAVDNTSGVWKSPANVSVNNVIAPTQKITHDDQEDLNVHVTGKSINALRAFVGEGTLVWGARTLDGNSQDWRYINVRRTLLFIEQSVKFAAKTYVFEANTAATWVLIQSMISSFLENIWRQGGLAGNNPDEAFSVEVGLGVTMTPNDILDGIMRITVKVAVVRPAEFIVITFQQKMQES